MKKRYGYFSDDGKEFIITTYILPRPWINILSNGKYGLLLSHTGGGFSWLVDCNLNRVTKWYQDVFSDLDGRYLYIKDAKTGEYWSPTYKPVMKELDEYTCRHGLGYTVIQSSYRGVRATITFYVPLKDTLEVWVVELANNTEDVKELELYTYLEWWIGTIHDVDRQFHGLFYDLWVEDNIMFVTKYFWTGLDGSWNRSWDHIAFISGSLKAESFEGSREAFIGPERSIRDPICVETGICRETSGRGFEPVGVFKYRIHLRPGERTAFTILIGAAPSVDEVRNYVKKYSVLSEALRELASVKEFWRSLLGRLLVKTPDKYVNFLANYWYKYQTISARILSRNAYYQQAAAYGFRDQLQDTLTLLLLDYEWAKRQIIEHARHQLSDGSVMHWWHEINDRGMKSIHSDTPLWLAFMVINYVKETGDFSILDEEVPFYDKGSATMFAHIKLAIDRSLNNLGRRGLPLFLGGDWNDGFNAIGLEGKAESAWMAEFLYLVLKEFSELCRAAGRRELSELYEERALRLRKAFNKVCWDGEWYVRGFKDNGEVIGSKRNSEGKIFLNAQSWAVISGIAPLRRALKAIRSAEKLLDTEYGPALFLPAYKIPDGTLGYITRYAPGMKENGGIFMHAVTWMIVAECLLKRARKAYGVFKKTCPAYRGLNPEKTKTEPYVTSEWIAGPDSKFFGEGWNSWLTGSAAWSLRVVVDYILGIRATFNGLLVDPCIPPNWSEFEVVRHYRGAVYRIHVRNPRRVSKGVREIKVDGRRIETNILPVFSDGRTHQVEVLMG